MRAAGRATARLGTCLALAVASGAFAASATAGTIKVTTTADAGRGSLADAIVSSEPGDTILIPPGEYTLFYGDVLEENDLTLRGAGEQLTTVIPSGGGDAFTDPGVTISNLTVGEPLNPPEGEEESGGVDSRAQVIALVVTFAIFLFVLELVRRRRLVERYALVWMTAALALLVLSIWTDGLNQIADLMGIQEPANAIFILAFGVGFLLLLNFSVASSRLSEETKILAQEVARLDQELRAERALRGQGPNGAGDGSAGAQDPQHQGPVAAEQPAEDG